PPLPLLTKMAKDTTDTTTTTDRKNRGSFIGRLFRGQLLSSDFFARNWLAVLITIVVLLLYITNKYTSLTNLEKIDALQSRLEIIRNEKAHERSRFMGRIRETSMQQVVDSLHLNLKVQTQPPYRIPAEK
ncbi:MAG: hypothetical protein K2K68_06310, partial [Duncaniella sp.]|nr:hypothetical protein [Duncaniella sp.]MDE6581874.1 hypothetical protein [Duncaniella sp.]